MHVLIDDELVRPITRVNHFNITKVDIYFNTRGSPNAATAIAPDIIVDDDDVIIVVLVDADAASIN